MVRPRDGGGREKQNQFTFREHTCLGAFVGKLPQGWCDVGMDLLRRPPGVPLEVPDVVLDVRVVCEARPRNCSRGRGAEGAGGRGRRAVSLFGGSLWLAVRECAGAWFARYRKLMTVPPSPPPPLLVLET